MRIACLVTVCSFLLTVNTVQSEHLVGFQVPKFNNVTSGSDLMASVQSGGQTAKIRSGTQVDAFRRRRNFPEGGLFTPDPQQSRYRRREEVRLPRRLKHLRLGRSDEWNGVQGSDDEIPHPSEIITEEDIHLEPVNRVTKKSALESIVDLMRRIIDPPKTNVGPLIGPVRFPGVGEKVYIRLPEPVQYESNHVLVRLVSPPPKFSSDYSSTFGQSLLPASSIVETSIGTSTQYRSSLLPPISSGNLDTNRPYQYRYVQSVVSPPAQDQIHESSDNAQNSAHNKDKMSFSSASSNNFVTEKPPKFSKTISRTAAYMKLNGNRHNVNLPTVTTVAPINEDEDSDNTSRMTRVQITNDGSRETPYSSFQGKSKRRTNRDFSRINSSWAVPAGHQKSIPIRHTRKSSVSERETNNSVNRLSAVELQSNPPPRTLRFSPPDLKSESNDWRGIDSPYDFQWRNVQDNRNIPLPENDFKFHEEKSTDSAATLQQLLKLHKPTTNSGEFSNQTAIRIIAAPNFRTVSKTHNKTSRFAEEKNNYLDYATSKNTPIFNASVYDKLTFSKFKKQHENDRSKKTIKASTLETKNDTPETDLSKNLMQNDEPIIAAKSERLESVLRIKDADGLPKFRISDSYEIGDTTVELNEKSKTRKVKELIKALKASSTDIESFDSNDDRRSKNNDESAKSSQEDILFSIMSMTASQMWENKDSPKKTKTTLGILNVKEHANKYADNKIQEASKNHRDESNTELLEENFADASYDEAQDQSVNFQNHKCANSNEDDFNTNCSCEYDAELTSQTSNESYEDKFGTNY